MVEFPFDATDHEPWLGSPHETPKDVALRAWMMPEADLDFDMACRLAAVDGEVYDALWAKVIAHDVDQFPEAAQAALARTLLRKRPAKVRDKTKANARLRVIGQMLKSEYPHLHMTSDIAAILAELPGVEMDQQSLVNNVLYR